MREICTSGSVRAGDGNIPGYSAERVVAHPELARVARSADYVSIG